MIQSELLYYLNVFSYYLRTVNKSCQNIAELASTWNMTLAFNHQQLQLLIFSMNIYIMVYARWKFPDANVKTLYGYWRPWSLMTLTSVDIDLCSYTKLGLFLSSMMTFYKICHENPTFKVSDFFQIGANGFGLYQETIRCLQTRMCPYG